jgi:hypothetical protein
MDGVEENSLATGNLGKDRGKRIGKKATYAETVQRLVKSKMNSRDREKTSN